MKILTTLRFSMKFLGIILIVLIIVYGTFSATSYAAHPLFTDDTGTQGKGKFLFELNGQASYDRMDSVDDTGANIRTKSREKRNQGGTYLWRYGTR